MIVPAVAGLDQRALRREAFKLREECLQLREMKRAREDLAFYIRRVWPWFILEEVHLLMCDYLRMLENNSIDRMMVFMAPRAGKSRVASIILPSHYMGRFPGREVMQAGHSDDLSRAFGRETKNLTLSDAYQDLFPGFALAPDSKSAGRWHTKLNGAYYATGLSGGIAGKGFHLGIIDDPLSEQDARSKKAQASAYEWYGAGFYTRQAADVSAILLMGTRWSVSDLFGQVLANRTSEEHSDDWAVLKIPAVIDEETAETLNAYTHDAILRTDQHPRRYKYKAGDSFAPRRWPLKNLLRRKANLSTADWEALYMQNPTQAEGGILKRAWWRKWPDAKPPKCLYVIQVYDTAFSEEAQENNDFSARTTWGIFEREEQKNEDGITMPSACVILLERMQRRMGFPELRVEAEEAYKKYEPDRVLIEKKASGQSLIQELRRLRVKGKKIPVVPVKRDTDKISRAYAASAILEHGFVYYMDREWAQGVIDECADFPNGGHDDLVDTCLDAWLWLRRTFHLRMRAEEDEEEDGIDLTPRRLYG